ncbi:MAG: ester cyclase [Bdellovibrionota bacterium]
MLETNKEIVKSFFLNVTNGDIDAAFKLVDDNVSWWVPGTLPFSGTKTKSEYLVVVSQITKGFPTGFKMEVVSAIAEGDSVAAEVISHGTHVNGKKYNNQYHFLIKVKNSKMIDVKEYMDTLHLHDLITP